MAESHFSRQRRRTAERSAANLSALLGLPAAIVLIGGLMTLSLAYRQRQSGESRSRYLSQAQQAMDADDWSAADILSGKLAQLRPDDPVALYLVARCADAGGNRDRAVRLMRLIAPADQPGLDLAQWWMIQFLSKHDGQLTHDELGELRGHLQQFLRVHDRHPEARMLLGQTELMRGDVDAALSQMSLAADANPELRVTVARIAGRLGKTRNARSEAEKAVRWLQQQARRDPDSVGGRLPWADALAMLGDLDAAAEVLLAGLERQDSPALRMGLVKLAVTAFDLLSEREERTESVLSQQIALLEKTLPLSPQHPQLLKRLAHLAVDPADTDGRAANLLEPYLETDTAPAVVYMILGRDALQRADYLAARRYFEQADRMQPEFAACLNNLAWSILQCGADELPRALELAERAIALQPQRFDFHETRGQILARLGRFDEAVPELQQGLAAPGDPSVTHAVLADAYLAIGETELAAHHRELE